MWIDQMLICQKLMRDKQKGQQESSKSLQKNRALISNRTEKDDVIIT